MTNKYEVTGIMEALRIAKEESATALKAGKFYSAEFTLANGKIFTCYKYTTESAKLVGYWKFIYQQQQFLAPPKPKAIPMEACPKTVAQGAFAGDPDDLWSL